MSIHYDQPPDPFQAAQDAGIKNIAQFLANAQDPEKPWIIYGAGCVLDANTIDPETLALWRSTGRITTSTEVDVPPLPSSPVLSGVTATPTDTTATIAWTTDIGSSTQVRYGPDQTYGTDTPLADPDPGVTAHTVELSGLAAETTYHYTAQSGANDLVGSSPDATFTTTTPPA